MDKYGNKPITIAIAILGLIIIGLVIYAKAIC